MCVRERKAARAPTARVELAVAVGRRMLGDVPRLVKGLVAREREAVVVKFLEVERTDKP